MPLRPATLFRCLLVLALGAHVFYMYGLARTMGEGFGFAWGRTVLAVLFALVLLLPFVWALMIPDLPEIITGQVRGRHRWSQGRCPTCGYRLAESAGDVCPECGNEAIEPRGYRITARTVRRFVVLNVLAWVFGCAASEMWISADESMFRVEAEQAREEGAGSFVRTVRWPGRGLYLWEEGHGCMRVHGATLGTSSGASAAQDPGTARAR